jgi:hypothetical protein
MLVRWDAVVQDNDFWSERARPAPRADLPAANRPVCVQVWLFGSLHDRVAQNPVTVEFRAPFSVRDVVAELGNRFGREFLERLTDSGGDLLRICRVFVNGQAIDDTAAPLHTASAQAEIELILLTAAEGG